VAAAASDQSRPIASRQAFLEKIAAIRETHGAGVARPKRWGGYRVWAERVELWAGQPGRAHDRAVWTRTLWPTEAGFTGGSWRGTRLQP
jgi:pyridoxamine 5'-phosphate oxidase